MLGAGGSPRDRAEAEAPAALDVERAAASVAPHRATELLAAGAPLTEIAPVLASARARATLTLVGKESASTFLDHGSDGTPSAGDEFVSAQRLLRQGRAAGHSGGGCQVVAPARGRDRNTFHCTMTLSLHNGQIALDGLATFGEQGPQPMTMAITGGTGSYRKARGQATVRERAGGETRYRLSIRR